MKSIGPKEQTIYNVIFIFTVIDDSRTIGYGCNRIAGIDQFIAQKGHIIFFVQNLNIIVHFRTTGFPMVIDLVAPRLVIIVIHINVCRKMNDTLSIIIPPRIGLYEAITSPSVGFRAKIHLLLICQIAHRCRFHEDCVSIEFHLPVKCKCFDLGVICASTALYDRPFPVFHRTAGFISGDTVFGIISHSIRTKGVTLLVYKFHKGTIETYRILFNVIHSRLAGKHCAVLYYPHISKSFNKFCADIPDCRIT